MVALFGPDGKKLSEVDSPNGTRGPEPISLIANASGVYRVEVRSLDKNAPAGRYEIRIKDLRAATTQDRSRLAAQQAFTEGEQLRQQQTAASRRTAIEKYEEALSLFRILHDNQGEATALNNVGLVYSELGDKQKALGYLNQSLPLMRAVGDRNWEAITLYSIGSIGVVYSDLGEMQKALDYYLQTLPLARARAA